MRTFSLMIWTSFNHFCSLEVTIYSIGQKNHTKAEMTKNKITAVLGPTNTGQNLPSN